MRPLLLILALLPLAACTGATLSKLDYRTYQIQSDGVPGGSTAPDRRVAEQVCPGGYRVLDDTRHQGTPNRYDDEPGVFITWTIRCL
jgi:hypothetical protein